MVLSLFCGLDKAEAALGVVLAAEADTPDTRVLVCPLAWPPACPPPAPRGTPGPGLRSVFCFSFCKDLVRSVNKREKFSGMAVWLLW